MRSNTPTAMPPTIVIGSELHAGDERDDERAQQQRRADRDRAGGDDVAGGHAEERSDEDAGDRRRTRPAIVHTIVDVRLTLMP